MRHPDDGASLKLVTSPAARMAAMAGSSLTTHLSLEAFVKTHNADDHPFVDVAAYHFDIVACLHLEHNGAAFYAQNLGGCGHPFRIIPLAFPADSEGRLQASLTARFQWHASPTALRTCRLLPAISTRVPESLYAIQTKSMAALQLALGGLPNQMRVEVESGIEVRAKTAGELRKVTTWPENLAITTPQDRYPESALRVSKANIATRTSPKA